MRGRECVAVCGVVQLLSCNICTQHAQTLRHTTSCGAAAGTAITVEYMHMHMHVHVHVHVVPPSVSQTM